MNANPKMNMKKYVTTTDGESPGVEALGEETHYGIAELLSDGTCRDIVPPTPGLPKVEADQMVEKLNTR